MISSRLFYFLTILFVLVGYISVGKVYAIEASTPIPVYPGAITDNTPFSKITKDVCLGYEKGPIWYLKSELPLKEAESTDCANGGWDYLWHWDFVSSDSYSKVRDWYLTALKSDGWKVDVDDLTDKNTDCRGKITGKINHTAKIGFSKSDSNGKMIATGFMDIDDFQRNNVGAAGCETNYQNVTSILSQVMTNDPLLNSVNKQNVNQVNINTTSIPNNILTLFINLINNLFNWIMNIFLIVTNMSGNNNLCSFGYSAIGGGTQYTHQNLKIGVGNIATEDYQDEKGKNQRAPTAGLWLYVKDNPAANTQIRVHTGQTVNISNWKILVDKISEQDKGFVCLKVETLFLK